MGSNVTDDRLAELLRAALLSTRDSDRPADRLAQVSILAGIQGNPELEAVADAILGPGWVFRRAEQHLRTADQPQDGPRETLGTAVDATEGVPGTPGSSGGDEGLETRTVLDMRCVGCGFEIKPFSSAWAIGSKVYHDGHQPSTKDGCGERAR